MYNNYPYNYPYYRYDNCCCFCGFIRCICNKIRYCLCPRPRRYYPYYHDGYGHGKDCGKRHYCGGNIGHDHGGSGCCDNKGYDHYIDANSYYYAIRSGRYCAHTKKF